jgi:oligoribonuclease
MHSGEPALMAGNSIHFDRSWIKMYAPTLDVAFGYRMLDVSSIKELVARWWPGREYRTEGDKPHRSLPDLRHSIAELRYYAESFMNVKW